MNLKPMVFVLNNLTPMHRLLTIREICLVVKRAVLITPLQFNNSEDFIAL